MPQDPSGQKQSPRIRSSRGRHGSKILVGQLQWLVTLGRFNLHAHVATMSRFRTAPRQRDMDRLKRIYAYAIRTKDYAVRFRTDQPGYSFLPEQALT